MTFRLVPHSYNGFVLNEVDKVSTKFKTPSDWNIQGITVNSIALSQDFPQRTGKNYGGQLKVLECFMNNPDADRNQLVIAMDVLGAEQHEFIAKDDLGIYWYLDADAIGMNVESVEGDSMKFGIVIDTENPIWNSYVETLTEKTVTTSDTVTITPTGNQFALPTIKITPTSAGGAGFLYKKFVQINNNSSYPLSNYPLNLTGAGLDTAAMINFTSKSVQINQGGGITAVATTIPIDTAVGGGLPTTGMGYCGTEQIRWTGNSGTQLTGVVRGIGGTTAATHPDNAVIALSKMLANGEDLRIYINGVEVKRWFGGGGINTTTTKIWINWNQPAKQDMTLGGAIAGAGDVTQIQLENTAANTLIMPTIPTFGNVLIGSEVFVYTGVDVPNLLLTGVTRASRGSAAASHALQVAVKFLTNDVWMYYGSSTIAAYVVDDTFKPIISLNSTNTSWVYAEFGNATGTRTGNWLWSLINLIVNQITGEGGGTNIDPFTAMGFKLAFSQPDPNVTATAIQGKAQWKQFQPCGVTTITVTGKKSRTSPLTWAICTFEKSTNDILYTNVWTETAPVVLANQDLDTHSAVALGGTYNYLRFVFEYTSAFYQLIFFEMYDITEVIDSTKVPTITFSAEDDTYTLNATITNAATAESINIILPMVLNTYLTIDVAAKTVTLFDGTNVINALQEIPIREEWLRLLPGEANVLTITNGGVVDYDITHRNRAL